MRYSLRQIEVFLTTAQHENISQAAQQLNMSQSAASSALKELESQFDIQLFDRVGKRLQLNEFGRQLWPKAQALLDHAEQFSQQLAQQHKPGHLKIGATLSIGNYLAVPIMSRYKTLHPGAQISLEVNNTAQIADKVAHFQLDIGLIEGELQHPLLDISTWRDDQLCLFAAPQHPFCQLTQLGDAELCSAKWIVREPGSGTRQTFDRAMSGLLADLNIELELQHTEAIKRAVEAGLGIGCLSQVTLKDAFQRGTLVELQAPERNFKRKFYFVLHKEKFPSAAIAEWIKLCQALFP